MSCSGSQGLSARRSTLNIVSFLKTIAWLKELLASEMKILALIKAELVDIRSRFGR